MNDRPQTVLRRTLHHPLIYTLVAIIVFIANVGTMGAGAIGAALAGFVVTWFLTGLLA